MAVIRRALLLGLLVPAPALAAAGTEFWLAFPYTYYPEAELILLTAAPGPVAVTVSSGAFADIPVTVSAGTPTRVPVPAAARITAHATAESKGIRVAVDDGTTPIRVFFQSPDTAGEPDTLAATAHDLVLALPGAWLGTEYGVLSYQNTRAGGVTFFTVVAVEDGTDVTVTGAACAGAMTVPTLDRGQTFQAQCPVITAGDLGKDLTGAWISATRPVAVLAGQRVADVVQGAGTSADFVGEMLLPAARWGDELFVAPTPKPNAIGEGNGDLLRIMAAADGTTVEVDDGTSVTSLNLDRGEWAEVDTAGAAIGDQDLRLRSTDPARPIAAAQYLKSRNLRGNDGDPAQMLLLPGTLWATAHRFFTPDGYSQGHHVTVVAPVGASVTLDGAPLTGWTAFPGGTAQWKTVLLADPPAPTGAEHTLTADAPVTAYPIGLGGFKSYASPAGGQLPAPSIDIWRGTVPEGLAPYAVGVASPWEDVTGTLSDGGSYYYRVESADTLTVAKDSPGDTVRLTFN